MEKYLNKEIALNPKARRVNSKKFFDYWVIKEKIAWDLKTLDGNSENVLNKSCKKKQAQNIVRNMRKTSHSTNIWKVRLLKYSIKEKDYI